MEERGEALSKEVAVVQYMYERGYDILKYSFFDLSQLEPVSQPRLPEDISSYLRTTVVALRGRVQP